MGKGDNSQLAMTEQAREARREYMKQWRAENRDKTREHQQRYWAKKARETASERKISEEVGSSDPEPKQGPSSPSYRFNLKLPMRQKEYLSEVAWRNRVSITEYITRLIDADMTKKMERKQGE